MNQRYREDEELAPRWYHDREAVRKAREIRMTTRPVRYPMRVDGHAKANRDNKAAELRGLGHVVLCERYPHGWDLENNAPVEYLLFDGGLKEL